MTSAPTFSVARPNLEVTNLDASIAFYEQALGLPLRFRADELDLAVLGNEGGCEFALVRSDAPHAASRYLLVTAVDALHAGCLESGAPIVGALDTRPWGMRDFVVSDPDANQIAIGERVAPAPWRPDAAGRTSKPPIEATRGTVLLLTRHEAPRASRSRGGSAGAQPSLPEGVGGRAASPKG